MAFDLAPEDLNAADPLARVRVIRERIRTLRAQASQQRVASQILSETGQEARALAPLPPPAAPEGPPVTAERLPTIRERLAELRAAGKPARLGSPTGAETVMPENTAAQLDQAAAPHVLPYTTMGLRKALAPLVRLGAEMPMGETPAAAAALGESPSDATARLATLDAANRAASAREAQFSADQADRHPIANAVGQLGAAAIEYTPAIAGAEAILPEVAAVKGGPIMAQLLARVARITRPAVTMAAAGSALEAGQGGTAADVAERAGRDALVGLAFGAAGEVAGGIKAALEPLLARRRLATAPTLTLETVRRVPNPEVGPPQFTTLDGQPLTADETASIRDQLRAREDEGAALVEARRAREPMLVAPETAPAGRSAVEPLPQGPPAVEPPAAQPEYETIYRGEYTGNKGGSHYTNDREWARQFTQSGQDHEIRAARIRTAEVYDPTPRVSALDADAIDAAVAEGRRKGFKAVRLDEGTGEPPSLYVFNKTAVRPVEPPALPAGDISPPGGGRTGLSGPETPAASAARVASSGRLDDLTARRLGFTGEQTTAVNQLLKDLLAPTEGAITPKVEARYRAAYAKMPEGTRVTIREGPFAGESGEVVGTEGVVSPTGLRVRMDRTGDIQFIHPLRAEPVSPSGIPAGAPHNDTAIQENLLGAPDLIGKPQGELLPETAGTPTAALRDTKIQPDETARLAAESPRATPPGEVPAELPLASREDYGGEHSPPGPDSGAPLHDLTGKGTIYPDDVYGPHGRQYYGTGEDALDAQTFSLAHDVHGKPNARVTIYRAIPDDITVADRIAKIEKQKAYILKTGKLPPNADTHLDRSEYFGQISKELDRLKAQPPKVEPPVGINSGDWVTVNRAYAKQHGESTLRGNYRIISKSVRAGDVFTNGDSIHEYGYWPEAGAPRPGASRVEVRAAAAKAAAAKAPKPEGVSQAAWTRSLKQDDDALLSTYRERLADEYRYARLPEQAQYKKKLTIQTNKRMLEELGTIGNARGLDLWQLAGDAETRDAAAALAASKALAPEDDFLHPSNWGRYVDSHPGAAHPAVLRALARAGVGGAVGAAAGARADSEHPLRGAVTGGLAGALLGAGAMPAGRALIRTRFGREFFTSAGLFPADLFGLKEARDAASVAGEYGIRTALRDFRAAAKEAYGRAGPNATDLQHLDYALKEPDLIPSLPPAMQPVVRAMRGDIDAASRRLIASGALSPTQVEKVTSNLGQYATRSYRIFDDPQWVGKIPGDVRNRALNLLAEEMPNAAPGEVEGKLAELLIKDPAGPFGMMREGKVGAKDLSILKRREDIAPEIRDLWGEYHDPRVNYARSMQKMTRLVVNQDFLTGVREAGLGRYFHAKPIVRDGVTYATQIAAEGSHVMAPLNGLYTSPEIADAFTQAFSPRATDLATKLWMMANGTVTVGKTVLSPVTQVRNFLSNGLIGVANGLWRAGKVTDGFRAILANAGAGDTPVWRAYVAKMMRLGVVGESANANELRAIFQDMGVRGDPLGLAEGSPVARAGRSFMRGAEGLYQASDEFWKVYGYENELARYRAALPNVPLPELEQRVAQIVRNTWPTYSKVPEAVKRLRRFPLVGNFVSWPAEIYRTLKNTVQLTGQELADPALRGIGAQRLAGLLVATTVVPAITMASRQLVGTSKRDEEDLRRFLPDWQRNSGMLHTSADHATGKYAFLDLGYSDPYAAVRDPLRALLAGRPVDAGLEATRSFFDEKILTASLLDLARNTTKTGGQVWNPQSPFVAKALAAAQHVGFALEPGGLTTARRIANGLAGTITPSGRSYKAGEEVVALATGQRVSRIDVAAALSSKVRHFLRDRGDARGILGRAANSFSGNAGDAVKAYQTSQESEAQLAAQLMADVQAARRLGLEDRRTFGVLRASGLAAPDARAIFAGRFVPYQPGPSWLTSTVQRAQAVGDPALLDRVRTLRMERRKAVAVAARGFRSALDARRTVNAP